MMLRMSMAAGAALLLAACNSGEKTDAGAQASAPASETAATPDAAADPAPAAAKATAGGPPSREFMVGKWAEDGDCTLAIDFKADGAMVGPVDKWELDDKGALTMVGIPGTMQLKVVDDKTMESRRDGTGDPRKLTRC